MTLDEIAVSLADAELPIDHDNLLERCDDSIAVELARLLNSICLESWTSDPPRSVRCAKVLNLMARKYPQPAIKAFAAWSEGLAEMINGCFQQSIAAFDRAQATFHTLGQIHDAASTQIAKLYPLSMLGYYEAAIECGLEARKIFLECGDVSAAGRIEHNLGNIFQRANRYEEAEAILRLAHERFLALEDYQRLAQISNSLAFVLSHRYEFRRAAEFYSHALKFAQAANLKVTQAEIESNIGYFALFQGNYNRALKFLERARTKYAELGMPHQSAIAELEMADAYLEINLHEEAREIYKRTVPLLADIEMPLEQARSLLNFARAEFSAGRKAEAHELLQTARQRFAQTDNEIGLATVLLQKAVFLFAEKKCDETEQTLEEARRLIARHSAPGILATINFMLAETWRVAGHLTAARALLAETLRTAESAEIPPLQVKCLTALGLIAAAHNNLPEAESYFQQAVFVTENLRAPLPSEEFRTAFFGDKLAPFNELVKIYLADPKQTRQAFETLEKSRSRALLELMQEETAASVEDNADLDFKEKIAELRAGLNWLYNQINSPSIEVTGNNLTQLQKLSEAARLREHSLAELMRQQQLRQTPEGKRENADFDLAELQATLGSHTVLIEFVELDSKFGAFVLSGNGEISFFPQLGSTAEINELSEQLRFQLDALRCNPSQISAHVYELTLKTRRVLAQLYDVLLRPLESTIGLRRRLAIVPHRTLHYVPFHALYDGFAYTIENREVVYAPSASILQNCLQKPVKGISKCLFVGAADKLIPFVEEEIKSLSELFPESVTLTGDEANWSNIKQQTDEINLLHLACHGHFRADNPLFSALKLADGWITVNEIRTLKLNAELVVLSACETGLSRIAAGDELLGLTRGLFSAGAASLILSLWSVHDKTTLELMQRFYAGIKENCSPAAALRAAQIAILKKLPHPFYWSPFYLIGRW
jgi:CHAT domain-containing protein/Tfp pilus assembly protein PilF